MKPAPDFLLRDQFDKPHSLSGYQGKWVVVYFYPKDDTPGCTKEACSFRDGREELERNGIVVLGISGDTVESHKKFADKYGLNFTLLADPERTAIKEYGALGEKTMFGKTYEGILRNTFVIDPEGNIVKEYKKVKPEDHAIKILEDIKQLQTT